MLILKILSFLIQNKAKMGFIDYNDEDLWKQSFSYFYRKVFLTFAVVKKIFFGSIKIKEFVFPINDFLLEEDVRSPTATDIVNGLPKEMIYHKNENSLTLWCLNLIDSPEKISKLPPTCST